MSEQEPVGILIVDDRPDGLLTMEAVLESPEYRLVKASSGPEALALLQDEEFAVILLDVQMPHMNGFETAALIKRRVASRDIPIIFVTAINKDPRFVFEGYRSGAVDYVFKPFDAEILRAKVAIFVDLFRKTQKIRQQAEEILAKEQQLQQARKLEAVGRLAGGVAHDFNNLITGILGISEDLKNQLDDHDPRREDLEEIIKASNRAFSLTKQLLAFGRRQMTSPKVIDLNTLINDLGKMVLRLLGEDIQLTTTLSPDLGSLKADPSQLEQVIINLFLNSRDAMPQGGRITISTHNIQFEKAHKCFSGEIPPGPYVALVVADTGCGMSAETLAHIFEPFFTTKEKDKGTGLGLSTVYGIVKQSNGEINVDTHSGTGTTFTLYFPRVHENVDVEVPADTRTPTGKETILVVEDEDIVRHVVRNLLAKKGYNVLQARDGPEAIELARGHAGTIDMIVTDVVMPTMNGRQVAEAILALHPDAIVLFMSGYTEDIINHRGILEPGLFFIDKSAVNQSLAYIVRELLDKRSRKVALAKKGALSNSNF